MGYVGAGARHSVRTDDEARRAGDAGDRREAEQAGGRARVRDCGVLGEIVRRLRAFC